MPSSPTVQLLFAFGVVACLFSLWKGGRPERIGALVILANTALSLVASNVLGDDLSYMAGLALDGVTALAFLAMTLLYGRLWLGAAMLIYAAQFALRSYYLVMQQEPDLLHARINNGNFLAIILCIVVGTTIAWRRRVKAAAARAAPASQAPPQ